MSIHADEIRAIAVNCGFKKKEQLDGSMDLNPYVYKFAQELWAEFQCRQAATLVKAAEEMLPILQPAIFARTIGGFDQSALMEAAMNLRAALDKVK